LTVALPPPSRPGLPGCPLAVFFIFWQRRAVVRFSPPEERLPPPPLPSVFSPLPPSLARFDFVPFPAFVGWSSPLSTARLHPDSEFLPPSCFAPTSFLFRLMFHFSQTIWSCTLCRMRTMDPSLDKSRCLISFFLFFFPPLFCVFVRRMFSVRPTLTVLSVLSPSI